MSPVASGGKGHFLEAVIVFFHVPDQRLSPICSCLRVETAEISRSSPERYTMEQDGQGEFLT